MNVINDKIKLVIWDLDETFWNGTLSEEGISYIPENHDIVIKLAERGIISSICSKNNYAEVEQVLIGKGLWTYFVFSEIDWLPKGQLVKKIIKDMGLRANNVLFIDDNLGNLNEVSFFNKGISVYEPLIISELLSSKYMEGKSDLNLSRLNQYKILEKKRIEKENSNSSNYDFLKNSGIEVAVNNDVIPDIERVLELVERTNQLNYTKYRCCKEELITDIHSEGAIFGHVSVRDKFGSYGISGFYLIKNNTLIHFLFSCRSMNMGIESWLFNFIGQPTLNVIGEVAIDLAPEEDYSYVKLVDLADKDDHDKRLESIKSKCKSKSKSKLLMVGGCDLDQVVHYLSSSNIDTDFNYVNSIGVNVHKEHTSLIKQLCFSSISYDDLLKEIPILGVSDKSYKLIDNEWDYLIYSPLNDYSRGLYKHKKTGFILPFDSFNINWCEEGNWMNIPSHLVSIPKSFFDDLRDNYDFIGAIEPLEFKENIELIAKKFFKRKIVLLSGSECELQNTKYWEVGMEDRHAKMNKALFELVENRNITIIDVRDLIRSDVDHLDNIRHYRKKVYMGIAKKIADIINDKSIEKLKLNNQAIVNCKLYLNKVFQAIKRKISR
jgi:FkbH-like protein